MKSGLECLACILKQSIVTAKLSTDDVWVQKEAVGQVLGYLSEISDFDLSPAELSTPAYRLVEKICQNPDPYNELKVHSTEQAKQFINDIRQYLLHSSYPLYTSAKLAIAGNVIDFGIFQEIDVEKEINQIMKKSLAIDHFGHFKTILEKKKEILYICDNCGEIYFDKIFANELKKQGKDIIFIVKQQPVINDATMEDALEAGLDQIGRVIDTGNGEIGLPQSKWTDEIKRIFQTDPMIISKGQGNFETLSDIKQDIFFLLKAKCPLVAKELGVHLYDIVFKYRH